MKQLLGAGIVILGVYSFVNLFVYYLLAVFVVRLLQFALGAAAFFAVAYVCVQALKAVGGGIGTGLRKVDWATVFKKFWYVPVGCFVVFIAAITLWPEPIRP